MKITRLLISASMFVVLAFSGTAMGDSFIKQTTHTDGFQMQGQNMQPRDDTVSMWLTDNMARSDSKDGTFIIRTDEGMLYMIDHEKKKYAEMPLSSLGDMKKMMGLDKLSDEEAKMMEQQMQGMMAMMQITGTITPTDETKKIKDYNCKKYIGDLNIGMMNSKIDYWASKDVELNYEAFKKLTLSEMLFMPGADKLVEEMAKMEGFVVYAEGTMNMMGTNVKTIIELLEVDEKDAPAGTYDIPEGYKKEEFNPMSQMGR
ncbi:MAG: DUF4412 domain-containing protein [candidate division Zixibacteria bacterium]|nr:DUF4412 domain-containing protein [candidate division Zixibacteria bacterium]